MVVETEKEVETTKKKLVNFAKSYGMLIKQPKKANIITLIKLVDHKLFKKLPSFI